MISFRGVYGIRNLYVSGYCDICGKKMKYVILCGSTCARCFVWAERHWWYLIIKYIRFSIKKYIYKEDLKPRSIPAN